METARQAEQMVQQALGDPPRPTEDPVTRGIERYTAAIPSSAYLGVAIGAMGLSLLFQLAGRGKWGNFVAQWVPTWLIIGVYNKLVKLEGHDRDDRGGQHERATARPVGISNRPIEEEHRQQQRIPSRGSSQID